MEWIDEAKKAKLATQNETDAVKAQAYEKKKSFIFFLNFQHIFNFSKHFRFVINLTHFTIWY